ncbi:hypothetical protein AVEN_109114-1 [Araneus ventricosus]|uniref:Uncharacterized protein n=1 Tax=Araneus ventricosus TaxID=182803 RepID=A0A4Y2PLA2_ARAVE|nr:hypothetical protein AVEN_109114-1 [Araneus ventricosus]
MDSSAPFSLSSSLRVVGDTNGRPFSFYLSPKGAFNDHSPNCLLPLSEQQTTEIRPTSIEVAWSVTAGLGGKVLTRNAIYRNFSNFATGSKWCTNSKELFKFFSTFGHAV